MVRLRLEPLLTEREARAMEERAAADLRSIGGYVAWLIAQDLAREPQPRPRTAAKLTDRREGYVIAVPLAVRDRKALEKRAQAGGARSPTT